MHIKQIEDLDQLMFLQTIMLTTSQGKSKQILYMKVQSYMQQSEETYSQMLSFLEKFCSFAAKHSVDIEVNSTLADCGMLVLKLACKAG